MKKVQLFTATLLLVLLTGLTACAFGSGTKDWKLSLPNGYEMRRVGSSEVIIGRISENGVLEKAIGPTVSSYYVDGRYVAAVQEDAESTVSNPTSKRYFLLNTVDSNIYGPFPTESAFKSQCAALNVPFREWISTTPAPSSASYG